MSLTPKQRAQLRSLAHPLKPVLYIGKDGVTDAALNSLGDAFGSRELLKVKVQSAAPLTAAEAGKVLGGVSAETVMEYVRRKGLPCYRPGKAPLFRLAEGLPLRRFSVAAQNRLRNYPWPGNVRELKNLVERLVILDHDHFVDQSLHVLERERRSPWGTERAGDRGDRWHVDQFSGGQAAGHHVGPVGLHADDLHLRPRFAEHGRHPGDQASAADADVNP